VRQHRAYEDWVTRYVVRHGPYGIGVVMALLLHRLRRGLTRRLNLAVSRVRSPRHPRHDGGGPPPA
jgi:hypothetical protein